MRPVLYGGGAQCPAPFSTQKLDTPPARASCPEYLRLFYLFPPLFRLGFSILTPQNGKEGSVKKEERGLPAVRWYNRNWLVFVYTSANVLLPFVTRGYAYALGLHYPVLGNL